MLLRMRISLTSWLPIVVLPVMLLVGCDTTAPSPAVKPNAPTVGQVPSPALVPGVSAAMNTAGFWIGRHPDPDRLVMSGPEVAAFNSRIRETDSSVTDIVDFSETADGEKLRTDLNASLSQVKSHGYYLAGGKQPDDAWWQSLQDNMDLAAIEPKVRVRFGLITGFCDHRVLPVTEGLFREDLNLSFDRLQDSTLDVGAPVVILHRSRDGRWLYAIGETLRGWVLAESVALCERDVLKAHVRAEKFAVVTAAKADLYTDENLRRYLGRAQMGTRLAVTQGDDPAKIRVLIPSRTQDGTCMVKDAYVQRTEVSLGYLPYTPRTILGQAFKLLHTPYGWGGLFGEQDCSRFLQEIFATVGLVLPRNSSDQAHVGRLIYENPQTGSAEEKRAVLREHGAAALTLLRMNGHIMLFLGFVDDRPYIIHDLWGYAIDESTVAVVNHVAVTPADLGSSASGSLLDRINIIRVLDAAGIKSSTNSRE